MMMTKRHNLLIALALNCVAALWADRASSASLDEVSRMSEARQFHIHSQAMSAALKEFANQAGVQILFPPELVAGRISPVVQGEKSGAEALRQLLDGSGLEFAVQGNTVAVRSVVAPTAELMQSEQAGIRMVQGPQDGAESASAEPKVAGSGDTIEEIVVTAQKREERIQDVPMSISVLSGEDLDSSTAQGLTEALRAVPGVTTRENFQGGGTQLAIRGVTAGETLFGGSSPAAYYLDTVPFGLVKSAAAPDANAYDLNRVEVLRGPQGTLYGASALNGVVRILSQDANLDAFEFKARTSAASSEEGGASYRGDFAVNVPIVAGKLAARAVAGYQDLGGWLDRPDRADANDAEIATMRLKLNAQPTDKLSIGMSAWLSRSDFGAPSVSPDGKSHPALLDESIATDYDVFGLKIGYDFPAFSVTSATSYLNYENTGHLDLNLAGLPDTSLQTSLDSKVFSEELTLTSTLSDAWRWTAGGMYRDAEDGTFQLRRQYVEPGRWTDSSESFAAFGELTRLLLDSRLELTGGLRYFEDDVTLREFGRSTGIPTGQEPVLTHLKFDAISPRVIVSWRPNRALTFYSSYAEGFRSGFDQNPTARASAPTLPSAKPDSLTNYELGTKGSLWGGLINFDAALYYIDWEDIQLPLAVRILGSNFSATVNSESASGMGFDFAATARPVRGLDLAATFSWNDLALDADVISGGDPLFPKGSRPPGSIEYTAGASAGYVFPLGANGFEGRLAASVDYNSPVITKTLSGTGVTTKTSDDMLTGRAGFSISSPRNWIATLFIDNVSNESGSPIVQDLPEWNSRIRPRTIGAQVEYRFK